jgi:DNA-binding MurR/RpiR family transcriptional regulator
MLDNATNMQQNISFRMVKHAFTTSVFCTTSRGVQTMNQPQSNSLLERINRVEDQLTPKGKILMQYVIQHPQEAVFLRTRGLAGACGVSEATVVRFVSQLGYPGYRDFIRALRDLVDTEMTLVDRVKVAKTSDNESSGIERVVWEEIGNLKRLMQVVDVESIRRAVDLLVSAPTIFAIGSRLSYTFAYYLGWSLTKVRSGITILKGSDSTAIDRLTLATEPGLAVIIATTRCPNELIRLAKVARRNNHTLFLIADSPLCPIAQFAQVTLIAPYERFPIVGSPSSIFCIINCLILEMINRNENGLLQHQEKLEKALLENDILFNLEKI